MAHPIAGEPLNPIGNQKLPQRRRELVRLNAVGDRTLNYEET